MFRRIVPWFGLILLAASFVCFLLLPSRPPKMGRAAPPRETRKKPEPFVVVLDPGHGGMDSGAIRGAVLEKELTLDVALRTSAILRAAGVPTVLTRDHDCYLSLAQRAALANRKKNSLFVSIHFNEGERATASGVETYFAAHAAEDASGFFDWLPFAQTSNHGLDAESESLAEALQRALVEHTRAVNRGTKEEQFYVIANVTHPAALVEGGFLNNPADVVRLEMPEYREQIAAAISEGILRYRATLAPNETALAWQPVPAE